MKNKVISITAIFLALTLFIFTGCNKDKEIETETTIPSVSEETEQATEIITNEAGETEIVTIIEEATEEETKEGNPEENTTETKKLTVAEIVKMFNTSVNRIKPEASKVVKNYEKRIVNQDKTEIPSAMEGVAEDMIASFMGDDTKPTTFSGKEEIKENFIVPQQNYSSKLTTDYVVKADCEDKGNTYEIYLKLKDHKNPTAGVGVGAVCDVIETHEIAQKASFIKEFTTTYYNCEIKATIDKSTGKITHIIYSTPLVMNMTVNLFGTHSGSIGFTFVKDYSITY